MVKFNNKEKLFIGSDYHLGHKNIIKYDDRPFKDISEHDETIIKNHNNIVNVDDDFIFLGDFSFVNTDKTRYYLSRLNGNKFFIKGNHDNQDIIKLYKEYGVYLGEQSMIRVENQDVVLNHYAMRVWNKSHRGSFLFYGHSHGSLEYESWGRSIDCGIMNNNYYPFSYTQLESILNKRKIKVVDHHTTR